MEALIDFLEREKLNRSLGPVAMEFCEWFTEEYERHNDPGYILHDNSGLRLAFKADNPYWCGLMSRVEITIPKTKCDAL